MPKRLAVLVNPTVGRGRAARAVGPVLERLEAGGVQVETLLAGTAAGAAQLGHKPQPVRVRQKSRADGAD